MSKQLYTTHQLSRGGLHINKNCKHYWNAQSCFRYNSFDTAGFKLQYITAKFANNLERTKRFGTMPVRRYIRSFQDLMPLVEQLLGLFSYFEQQNVVRITARRAVEHDDLDGEFQQGPINYSWVIDPYCLYQIIPSPLKVLSLWWIASNEISLRCT